MNRGQQRARPGTLDILISFSSENQWKRKKKTQTTTDIDVLSISQKFTQLPGSCLGTLTGVGKREFSFQVSTAAVNTRHLFGFIQMSINLNQAKFMVAAHKPTQWMPDNGKEVAFAGRSNSGKSSAINAITGRKGLAITSKTPGRTTANCVF